MAATTRNRYVLLCKTAQTDMNTIFCGELMNAVKEIVADNINWTPLIENAEFLKFVRKNTYSWKTVHQFRSASSVLLATQSCFLQVNVCKQLEVGRLRYLSQCFLLRLLHVIEKQIFPEKKSKKAVETKKSLELSDPAALRNVAGYILRTVKANFGKISNCQTFISANIKHSEEVVEPSEWYTVATDNGGLIRVSLRLFSVLENIHKICFEYFYSHATNCKLAEILEVVKLSLPTNNLWDNLWVGINCCPEIISEMFNKIVTLTYDVTGKAICLTENQVRRMKSGKKKHTQSFRKTF